MANMDKLLSQQELYLSPQSGSFDTERVIEAVRPLGHSWQHPAVPAIFLIFRTETSKARCEASIARDPNGPLPYVLLIKVEPDEIVVNQFAGSDFAEYSRTFLTWLLANYACTASNEEGTDLTAHLS
jgi:hypothetical protein